MENKSLETMLILAPVSSRSGYGDHARDVVTSFLDLERYDIKIQDCGWGNTPRTALDDESISKLKRIKDCLISQTNGQFPMQPKYYVDIRIPNEFQQIGKFNIGITAGIETNAVSQKWIEGVNKMDLNIVPSEHSKRGFVNSAYEMNHQQTGEKMGELKLEKPMEVLFEGVDENVFKPIHHKEIDTEFFDWLNDVVPEKFAYLFLGQWIKGGYGEDRKDIFKLVKLFCETFANRKNAPALILKTSGAKFSLLDREECMNKVKSIKAKFPKDIKLPNIYILHGELTQEELNYLYNHPKIKSMVSFTHGEGFGRPLLEASMVGLPVITSAWSGPLDFLHKDESILLGGTMEKVPPAAVWEDIIIPESQWFVVDETNARNALDHMYQNHSSWKRAAGDLMEKNRDRFKLSDMTTRLGEIMDRNTAELPVEKTFNQLPVLETIED